MLGNVFSSSFFSFEKAKTILIFCSDTTEEVSTSDGAGEWGGQGHKPRRGRGIVSFI